MSERDEAFDRLTPAESRLHARRLRRAAGGLVLLTALLAALLHAFSPNRPVEYEDSLEHFYYGSTGSDVSGGLPLKVLQVLPEMFPEYLPAHAEARDYTAFGFIREPGRKMPIGFSERRRIVDFTGINCAACHTGSVRASPGEEARVIPGMPANTADVLGFFSFLFDVAADERFTGENVVAAFDEAGLSDPTDPIIYRLVIPRMKEGLLAQRRKLAPFFEDDYPEWGPGRVNTFDPFKFDQFAPFYAAHDRPVEEIYGIADLPSVWNQARRNGLELHWDGNNTSARERNFSAAIASGAHPKDVDLESLDRIDRWLDTLRAPDYPFAIDRELAGRGETIYQNRCASCHSYDGDRVGTVIPIEEIGTDRHRMDSYTDFLLEAQRDYTAGYAWQFDDFTNTDGYAARPLGGIWARAPYLHNGSVPTMRDLLRPASERPVVFTRGGDVYDREDMGFVHRELAGSRDSGYVHPDGRPYEEGEFVLDTRLPGNGKEGHSGPRYGTTLSDADRNALIEYLKTL